MVVNEPVMKKHAVTTTTTSITPSILSKKLAHFNFEVMTMSAFVSSTASTLYVKSAWSCSWS